MKGIVICLLVTGSCLAQEEKHLEGNNSFSGGSENKIIELLEKREVLEMEVAIYPNPSEGNFFIEGHNGASVTLYSSEGTYVGTWIIGEGQKIEITDLPQGSFICTINEGTTRTIKKIVVI
jgi:hypothetical protein